MAALVLACPNLQELPPINMAAVTSTANGNITGGSTPSLKRIRTSGMRFSFTVANCQLSAAATNEIFEGLPTVATSQTITVSGNPNQGFNASIANAKNWVVAA
jgi:methionine synthase I (cobalamin-dependent)